MVQISPTSAHCHGVCTLSNPSLVLTHQRRLIHATLLQPPFRIPTRRPLRSPTARFHSRRGGRRPIRDRVRRARSRIIRSSRTHHLKLHRRITLAERARRSPDGARVVTTADGAEARRDVLSGDDTLEHF